MLPNGLNQSISQSIITSPLSLSQFPSQHMKKQKVGGRHTHKKPYSEKTKAKT